MAEAAKGLKKVMDEDGRTVCFVKEFNGHNYPPYESFIEKMESYWESFPVNDTDIYLLNYPKSGM